LKSLLLILTAALLAGCVRLKGVVQEEGSGRPVRTAVLTVGRPDGIGVLESHPVNQQGEFDFKISTADVHKVYVYDSAGSPEAALHLTESQLSDHMKLKLPRARRGEPEMVIPRP
jgi:hypothetical protein